jgi:hypothetical protein
LRAPISQTSFWRAWPGGARSSRCWRRSARGGATWCASSWSKRAFSLLGGALGLLVAMRESARSSLGPRADASRCRVGIDLPILAVNLGLSIAAGLVLASSRRSRKPRACPGLSAWAAGNTDSRRSARARAVFVAAEVGLSLVLARRRGPDAQTLQRLQAIHPGFRADHLLSVQLSLPKRRYASPEAIALFAQRDRTALRPAGRRRRIRGVAQPR